MNTKWIAISLGTVLGLSHIGMIGMISRQNKFPVVNVPVGPYTSYKVEANKEGYRIVYRANDPKTMLVERDIKKKLAFWDWVTTQLRSEKKSRWMGLSIDPTRGKTKFKIRSLYRSNRIRKRNR